MILSNTTVRWGRPVANATGTRLVYTSKCGRFSITRRTWVLPLARIGYSLIDTRNPSQINDCDTLRDAKHTANAILEMESDDAEVK